MPEMRNCHFRPPKREREKQQSYKGEAKDLGVKVVAALVDAMQACREGK